MTVTYSVSLVVDNIGTIDLGDQLDSLTLSTGSYDGIELPQASRLNFSFYGTPKSFDTNMGVGWWLGKKITLTLTRSTGGSMLWKGWVQAANFQPVDARGKTFITNVQAAGLLSALTSRNTNLNGFPAEPFFDRAAKLENDIRFDSWQVVASKLTWETTPSTKTWSNWDNFLAFALIEGYPSTTAYPLEAETASPQDCLSYIQDLANGMDYWLWENPAIFPSPLANSIRMYQKSTLATYSAKTFDFAANTLTFSLGAEADVNSLINYVTVSNSSTSVDDADYDSIDAYDVRPLSITSKLSVAGDMQTIATNRVLAYASPTASITRFTVDLDNFTSSDASYVPFMVGTPQNIILTNLPAVFGQETRYQIRGVNLSLTTQHAEAELIVVPYSVYAGATRWGSVGTSALWNNYATPVTTWELI